MQLRSTGLVIGAGFASALFVVGLGLALAWPALFPEFAHQRIVPANRDQVAQNGVFQFNVPPAFLPEPQAAPEEPLAPANLATVRGAVASAQECAVSGPHVHGNLAVFLIHGKDTLKNQEILTLQEGLEQNVAVVHETGSMQLFIDNRSNQPLFIQAGDIIKGGTQDRVIPYDLVAAPQTNRLPLAVVCVEQGRSFPRGNEMSASFQTATEQLPGKKLKLAAYRQSQQEVWQNVQQLQANLTRNVVGFAKAELKSETSLQLTLENQRVQNAIQDYMVNLAPVTEGKADVIGYAVAVNGKIHTADVYASSALFQKLWPKLIRANAVEALAEAQQGAAVNAPDAEAVQAFLSDAEAGQAFRRQLTGRTTQVRQETPTALLYDTCDSTQNNLVLHRSLLTK